MDVVAVTAVVLLVLSAVWAGDWLRRSIDEYQNDENHK